jgi:hypothetical protein
VPIQLKIIAIGKQILKLPYTAFKYGTVQNIKQRFEIIGNDPKLNRAIEKAIQVLY